MKKILKLFLIITISFFSVGSIPSSKNEEFNLLERKVIENNKFIENGVRVQYELSNNINEYENLKNIFLVEFGKELKLRENSISYENENLKVFTSFSYNEDTTFIQIDIKNFESKNKVEDLKNKIEKIINNKKEKPKFFSYIKVKIEEENKNYNYKLINKSLKDEEMIKIENGEVGKAFLKDGTRVNIGYVRYKTGDYVVIGTPVIFVTY